jgi:nickel-type superoxide dismutase maturation protease
MPEVDEAQTYHSRMSGRMTTGLAAPLAAAVGVLAWVGWMRPFRIRVEGDSMEPAYRAGDLLVATRRGRIRPGAVVVAEHPLRPGFELIKRLRYAPGDLSPGADTLGGDEYWIEGDRPERSTDSRQFGPVSRAAIRGIVRFRYAKGNR